MRDAFLTARMRVENLFDRGCLIVRINVPNLELAGERAHEKVILVDLVEEGRVLVVIDLILNALHSCLDIDIADQNLLVFEARNGEDRR